MIDQRDTIAFLSSGAAFSDGAAPVRHDTHAAIVFLSGTRAWKLKRAVRFAYLDFSTADRRRAILDRELDLNGQTTRGLYIAVHPITRADNGALAIDGAGVAVDWLLEMHRLPEESILDRIVDEGRLDDLLARRIADGLFAFHAGLPAAPVADPVGAVHRVIIGNRRCMELYPELLDPAIVAGIARDSEALLEQWSPLVRERAAHGRVRHGHGDLHLGNIAVVDGVPTPFDRLEFDDAMATGDVLYDLAFLLMDLWQRGRHRQANLILNRYLDLSAGDENGLALLPLFLSMRAAVRAHVEASKPRSGNDGRSGRARAYLYCAAALLESCPSHLIAIGGLSGTGKSTLARALAFRIGRAPGARIIASDVLRKRAQGLAPEQRLPASSYDAESGRAVYKDMFAVAAAVLGQSHSPILDATFATAGDRSGVDALAMATQVAGTRLWLRSADALRIQRVRERRDEASDAGADVATDQREPDDRELDGWRIMSADHKAEAVAGLARDVAASIEFATSSAELPSRDHAEGAEAASDLRSPTDQPSRACLTST